MKDPLAILTLDPDRRVTSWSPGAEATFGYTEPEMLGHHRRRHLTVGRPAVALQRSGE
jgi:PAS domain S-box-containing protein